MQLSKPELRTQLKASRLALSPEERTVKSRVILEKLYKSINWRDVESVHIYEPLLKLGEVDISGFAFDGKLFTSRKIAEEWRIVAIDGTSPIPEQFDVIIVPMLGFDSSLHRIGYGGGYYDKFLTTQPKAKKIGICFEIGRLKSLPVEPHDISLDMIVTEQRIY